MIEYQRNKLHDEIDHLKKACENLEDLKSELEKELKSLRQTNQYLESTNEKFKQELSQLDKCSREIRAKQSNKELQLETINTTLDKELLELKRSSQEKSAEKSRIENQLKKCLDEKKYFSNRVHELSRVGECRLILNNLTREDYSFRLTFIFCALSRKFEL